MSHRSHICLRCRTRFNPRPPKRTLCREGLNTLQGEGLSFNPRPPKRTLCLWHDRANSSYTDSFNPRPPKRTLCHTKFRPIGMATFVSIHVLRRGRCVMQYRFTRAAIRVFQSTSSEEDVVSVVRTCEVDVPLGFNPRPPKRTLCLSAPLICTITNWFQSTSSEEDVVSGAMGSMRTIQGRFNPRPPKRTLCRRLHGASSTRSRFNPRPPKRTLCR